MLEMETALLNKSAVPHKKRDILLRKGYTYFLQAVTGMKNNRRQ